MRQLASRGVVFVLTAFIAVTAIAGAIVVIPGLPASWIEGSPFIDYTIPAVALGAVGVVALIAAALVVVRPSWAGPVAVVAGLAMVVFELVEIAVVGFSLVEYGLREPVAWLQVVYIVIGVLTASAGLAVWWLVPDVDRSRSSATGQHARMHR